MKAHDTIVMAAGVRSHDPISESIRDVTPEVFSVGDCCIMPGNGYEAIHHAAEIARRI